LKGEGEGSSSQSSSMMPSWVSDWIRQILSNIRFTVNHLIVKYVHAVSDGDIVTTLTAKRVNVDAVGEDWKKAFVDPGPLQLIRKLCQLEDLSLSMDFYGKDGKKKMDYGGVILSRAVFLILDFRASFKEIEWRDSNRDDSLSSTRRYGKGGEENSHSFSNSQSYSFSPPIRVSEKNHTRYGSENW